MIEKFDHLLSILDGFWSMTRGVEGLLPTAEYMDKLTRAAEQGIELWDELVVSTKQSKSHLTFDVHILEQMIDFDGLADKTDEYIEKGCQHWKKYQAHYCCSADTVKQQKSIFKAEPMSHHQQVGLHIEKTAEPKQSKDTRRKRKAQENQETERAEKLTKREGYFKK